MLVRAGIGERADALMRPLLGRLGDLTSLKGIESIWPILGSIERFEEILHRRVIGGIADKYDLEAAEQRLNVARSEEHTSELQSLMRTSYAVFCLKKKTTTTTDTDLTATETGL